MIDFKGTADVAVPLIYSRKRGFSMAQQIYKTRDDSRTIMTELVIPNDTNLLGNLLGGTLLHWIDIAGALTATRHCESLVATVTMDMIHFKHPIKLGNIVTLTSYVTWTGTTSLETAVEVYVEDAQAKTKLFITKVYIVFVSLDENGKKKQIVPFQPSTEGEAAEFNTGFARRLNRLS
jgi:acyl-CoA hydrolase